MNTTIPNKQSQKTQPLIDGKIPQSQLSPMHPSNPHLDSIFENIPRHDPNQLAKKGSKDPKSKQRQEFERILQETHFPRTTRDVQKWAQSVLRNNSFSEAEISECMSKLRQNCVNGAALLLITDHHELSLDYGADILLFHEIQRLKESVQRQTTMTLDEYLEMHRRKIGQIQQKDRIIVDDSDEETPDNPWDCFSAPYHREKIDDVSWNESEDWSFATLNRANSQKRTQPKKSIRQPLSDDSDDDIMILREKDAQDTGEPCHCNIF